MLDSVRFNIINRNDELLAYSKDYTKHFTGHNKQNIVKLLREEFGPGHCMIRRKRLVYTKASVKKNNTES